MKRLIFSLNLLLVAACAPEEEGPGAQAAGQDPKSAPEVGATRVEVATVRPTVATLHLVRPGEVEPGEEARVAAALGGFVERINVDVGDVVRRGQVLAKVDTSLQAANKKLVEVELADAQREFDRLKSMGSAVSRVRVDAAKTRLERAKAQLAVATIQTSRTMIKAPFSGTIADAPVVAGEVAPPGMTIMKVVQLDPAKVSVAVSDRDVVGLKVGGKATVQASALSSPVEGEILRLDPTADTKSRAFTIEVSVPNKEGGLLPGMIANVDFHQEVAQDQIIIPQDFLVTRLQENGVYVVDDQGTARWRRLELGALVRDQIVVLKGLKDGDKVVTLGQRGLADGDRVIVAREGVCCENGRITYGPAGPTTVSAAKSDSTESAG